MNKGNNLVLQLDLHGEAYFEIRLQPDGNEIARIVLQMEEQEDSMEWNTVMTKVEVPNGIHPLYLIYHGAGCVQLKEIVFNNFIGTV